MYMVLLHPVCSHNTLMYALKGSPPIVGLCSGVQRSISIIGCYSFLEEWPGIFVLSSLTNERWGRWPESCFLGCYLQDIFLTPWGRLAYVQFNFFSEAFVNMHTPFHIIVLMSWNTSIFKLISKFDDEIAEMRFLCTLKIFQYGYSLHFLYWL